MDVRMKGMDGPTAHPRQRRLDCETAQLVTEGRSRTTDLDKTGPLSGVDRIGGHTDEVEHGEGNECLVGGAGSDHSRNARDRLQRVMAGIVEPAGRSQDGIDG